MSRDGRLVQALVACYPAGWRRRYGDEYAQLLCDLRVQRRPALIVDSLRGAARAHGGVLMATTAAPMTIAVWATGLFTVAGIGFAKIAEDFTGTAGPMYALLVVAAAVALLALAAAAAPSMLGGRAAGAGKYLAVPIAGFAVWFGVLRLVLVTFAGRGPRSALTVTGFLLIAVTGIALIAATAWAAATFLRRVPPPSSSRLRPVAVTTEAAAMAVATVAALVWGLQIRAADPDGFRGDHGILATPFVPSWLAVVVALAAAAVLTGVAARRNLAPAVR